MTAVAGLLVDVVETVGAPSPTAVLHVEALPDDEACARLVRDTFPSLRAGVELTKTIVVSSAGDDRYACRFVQVLGRDVAGVPVVATRRDCINSMVAAGGATIRRRDVDEVSLTNADTGLAIVVRRSRDGAGLDVETLLSAPVHPGDAVVTLAAPGPRAAVVTVNNPYLLVHAGDLGLTTGDLVELRGVARPELVASVASLVAMVREHLALPADEDLPKLALLLAGERELVARTVYLDRWHPGLPLTGLVNFVLAALVPGSPWAAGEPSSGELLVRSPIEVVRVGTRRDDTGAVVAVTVGNREVVTHAERLRL